MSPKTETLGERIYRIRGEEYQADFGKRLGVSQGTVSAWEKDDEQRLPSAEIYFRLAMMASDPMDHAFFLERAGLSPEVILRAAANIRAERSAPPVEGEIIRVPRIRRIRRSDHEESPLLPLPALAVENPASTGYVVIDGPGLMGDIQRGDIVIIDTSADSSRSLEGLWDNLVLFEWYRPEGVLDQFWSTSNRQSEGFHMGTLRCKADTTFRGGRAGLKDWLVVLERFPHGGVDFDPAGTEICMGEMQITSKEWKSIGAPKSREELAEKRSEVERMRFKLFDGIELFGRVLFWFTPIKQNPSEP